MPSLQETLLANPPTTSGVHEAMAQHAEGSFKALEGILPLFLGKRTLGSYITLPLPKAATQSANALCNTLGGLIATYDLRLASFLSTIRLRDTEEDEPKLGAILVTADKDGALFQLPWDLDFDSDYNLISSHRSRTDGNIIDKDVWREFFEQRPTPEERESTYRALVAQFGDSKQLPPLAL